MFGSVRGFLQQVYSVLPSLPVSKDDRTLFYIHMTRGWIDGQIDVWTNKDQMYTLVSAGTQEGPYWEHTIS